MAALQPADDEMAARQGLKMFGEGGVDRRAADRADHRHGLGGEFLADRDAEARGDLRDQPRDDRRRLAGEAAPSRKRALSLTDRASAARTAK